MKTPKKPSRPPFDPIEEGRKAVELLKGMEGGAWTGAELGERYALTPSTLHKRRATHGIVYWRDAKNQFHYPKWQFNAAGAALPGIRETLRIFQSTDEWRVTRYFLCPRHQLGGRTPLALLRESNVSEVLAHAKIHCEENTW